MSQEEAKLFNAEVLEKLNSRSPEMVKEAEDMVNDFTRTKVREDGIMRRIIPFTPISNDQLDRQHWTEKPIKVVDKEPNSPASISVSFGTLPDSLYMRGLRYPVHFCRIVTPRFTKDVDELRTWVMDLRQVLSDNSIKDMLAEEDGKFLRAINTAIVGPQMVVPTSGVVQYDIINGSPSSKEALCEMLKVMPNTPSNLEVHTVLLNQITIKDVMKLTHQEVGDSMVADIARNGWTMKEFLGVQWCITIKKGLVPTNVMYQFADPKFIGKAYELEAPSMYIKREAFFIEFFSYETIGAGIGHTSGLSRTDYET